MKKRKYFIRLHKSKVEVEGFITEHLDREFGIDKRDNGWCVSDVKTGLSVHPREIKYFPTKNKAIEYIEAFTFTKFMLDQLEGAEEKLIELPVETDIKIIKEVF